MDIGAPAKTAVGYDIALWMRWHDEHMRDRSGDGADRESTRDADRRYKVARADREQRKAAEEAGRLITTRAAEDHWCDLCKCFVGLCDRAPSQLCVQLELKGRVEIKRIMAQHFADVRRELTRKPALDRRDWNEQGNEQENESQEPKQQGE